jgi:hypothetical protein
MSQRNTEGKADTEDKYSAGGVRWSYTGKVATDDVNTQMRVTRIKLKPSLSLENLLLILNSKEVGEGMDKLAGLIVCEIVVVEGTMLVCTKYVVVPPPPPLTRLQHTSRVVTFN